MNLLRKIANDQSGAATVDWVVMTSAIVGIGMAVMVQISGGLENASGRISSGVGDASRTSGLSQEVTQTAPTLSETIQALRETGLSKWKIKRQLAAGFEADAPEGYEFKNKVVAATELPIYRSVEMPRTFSIGGEVMTRIEYLENVDAVKLIDYVENN